MALENNFQEKLKKHQFIPADLLLWKHTILYSLVLFGGMFSYYLVQVPTVNVRVFNRVFADVGLILIGLSLILSSVCYFWNFADRYIVYRKHLGLVGFAYIFTHGILSLFFMSNLFPFPQYYLASTNIIPFVFAVLSMGIFIFMTAISNKYAIVELGGKRWRMLMRIGIVAYAFGILHFGMKGTFYWMSWFAGEGESLTPPMSLLVFLFGSIVVLLRGSLSVALRLPKRSK